MPKTSRPSNAAETIRHRWRFAVVLAASLLLAVAQPLTAGLFNEEGSFDVFFSLLIVAVLLLVFEEREHRRIAFSLGVAAFLGIWVGHAVERPGRPHTAGRSTIAGRLFLCVRLVRDSACHPRETASRETRFSAPSVDICSWVSSGASCTTLWRRLPPGPLSCHRQGATRLSQRHWIGAI